MNDKRVSFMDNDKRIADFLIRLKHDGLTKTKFFRAVLTGYLERDENIVSFVDRYKATSKSQSLNKSNIVRTLEKSGKESKSRLGLDDGEIQNIFDILEKEHPDL